MLTACNYVACKSFSIFMIIFRVANLEQPHYVGRFY